MKRFLLLLAALVLPAALAFSCAVPTDSSDLDGNTTGEGGEDSSSGSGDTGGYGGASNASSATSSGATTSGSTSAATTSGATTSSSTTSTTTTSSTTTSAATGGGCDPFTCIALCIMTGELGQCVGNDCVCMGLDAGFP